MMVRIFLSAESNIRGHRFPGGPTFLPGFWSADNNPVTISGGGSSDCIEYRMLAISLWSSVGAYLMYSMYIPSLPQPFFILLVAFVTSSVVINVCSGDGLYSLMFFSMFSGARAF